MFRLNHINHRDQGNHSRGFTIAEMIIVMAVMAITAAIGAQTYIAERDRFQFNNALTKTMQLIKSVREYATTSYPIYVAGKNVIPKGGYGLHMHLDKERGKSTITIFANLGDATDYQKDDGLNQFEPAKDQVLETYTLPSQIDFRYFYFNDPSIPSSKKWVKDQVNPENTGPTAFEADLLFKPPLGDMAITGTDKLGVVPNLEQLGLQFKNPADNAAGPKKCQRITINRVKAFPELTYQSTCD